MIKPYSNKIVVAVDGEIKTEKISELKRKCCECVSGRTSLELKIVKLMPLLVEPGMKIEGTRSGTLSAFAHFNSPEKNITRSLVSLLSKHVAPLSDSVMLDNECFGTTMLLSKDADIAAARVTDTFISRCDGRITNKNGVKMPCRLYKPSNDRSYADITTVCLRGATTKLGIGTLDLNLMKKFVSPPLLVIRGNQFCGPGDSRALVFAESKDGNYLWALGILKGGIENHDENSERCSVAVPLYHGLDALGKANNGVLRLTDNANARI